MSGPGLGSATPETEPGSWKVVAQMTVERGVITHSSRETEEVAARLAPGLAGGDCVLLVGDLGGGKTTFTRGVARGLGHPDPREVASPTFALHHRYLGGRIAINHLDLYRLTAGPQMAIQGILDPLEDADAVTIIEWAERLGDPPPMLALTVDFAFRAPDVRALDLRFHGDRGERLLRIWERPC
jgi:tRNA threonylcarbamoyladenosine biosynthesis protein TsaE